MLPTRPIPRSLTEPFPDDPPANIGRAMGGGAFFFEVGARAIARIGILRGLSWRLPFGESRDKIDLIHVLIDPRTKRLTMEFRRITNDDPVEHEFIRSVSGMAYSDLLSVYHRETGATA